MRRPGIAVERLGKKDQLSVVNAALDNARRLIEAGKGRRWEVFKWATAINFAIAGLVLARPEHALSLLFLDVLVFADIFVTSSGVLILWHYNKRMKGARRNATNPIKWLERHVVNLSCITEENETKVSKLQDVIELTFFSGGIILSGVALPIALSLIT
jgi:hypothetical protein